MCMILRLLRIKANFDLAYSIKAGPTCIKWPNWEVDHAGPATGIPLIPDFLRWHISGTVGFHWTEKSSRPTCATVHASTRRGTKFCDNFRVKRIRRRIDTMWIQRQQHPWHTGKQCMWRSRRQHCSSHKLCISDRVHWTFASFLPYTPVRTFCCYLRRLHAVLLCSISCQSPKRLVSCGTNNWRTASLRNEQIYRYCLLGNTKPILSFRMSGEMVLLKICSENVQK